MLDGGEEERRREPKENEAIDGFDRAKQLPAVREIDLGVTEARDRFERIEHCWSPGRQGAKPEGENSPGRRFDSQIYRRGERRERDKNHKMRRLFRGHASIGHEQLCGPEYR